MPRDAIRAPIAYTSRAVTVAIAVWASPTVNQSRPQIQ